MDFKPSNHLKDFNSLNVEILTTEGNCTTYLIKQTQGAEYGAEAEAVRSIFESALNEVFGKKESDIEAECEKCDWKGLKEDMDEDTDDDHTLICPDCGSDEIYYFK